MITEKVIAILEPTKKPIKKSNVVLTKKQIQALKKVCPKNSKDLPILRTVLIKDKKIISTDLETSLTFLQSSNHTGCLPADKIELINNNTVKIPDAIFLNSDDFPLIPKVDGPETVLNDINQFMIAITKAVNFISDDEIRMALNYVLIEPKTNKIVATNGHRLAKLHCDMTGSDSLLLTQKTIDILKNLCPRKLLIFNDSKYIKISGIDKDGLDFELIQKFYNAIYPNYEKIIPKQEYPCHVTFYKDKIFELDAEVKSLINTKTKMIIFDIADDFNFTVPCEIPYSIKIGGAYVLTDKDIKIGFNYDLLKLILKYINTNEITIHINKSITAVYFVDGNDYYLLMPLRIIEN